MSKPLELFILIMNYNLIPFLEKMDLFQSIRNIQSLAIEIYKFLHSLSPAIMSDIIKLKRPPTCNLRIRQKLYSRNTKTVRYGI